MPVNPPFPSLYPISIPIYALIPAAQPLSVVLPGAAGGLWVRILYIVGLMVVKNRNH